MSWMSDVYSAKGAMMHGEQQICADNVVNNGATLQFKHVIDTPS